MIEWQSLVMMTMTTAMTMALITTKTITLPIE